MLVYFINYNPKLHLCVLGLLVYLLCVNILVKRLHPKRLKYLIANKCKKSYLGKPFKSSKVKFKFSNIGRFYKNLKCKVLLSTLIRYEWIICKNMLSIAY